ncbi:MAG: hypothetical protein CL670_10505 [Balneola sp.]|nr:hypothetical protein [Balneola sp.]MBE79575.1 hypothetical protein [Balneola sp.]
MTVKPTYCFIINCASNSFKAASFLKSKERQIAQIFGNPEFVYIQKDDSIVDIVREKANEFTHIIACGGDGTVNRVANGIMGSEAILGVLPLGSGNDFAQSIGLGNQFEENLSILKKGKTRPTDVIEIEKGFFVNTFGIGVDGLTNYYASKSRFKKGALKYFSGGLIALFKSTPFKADLSIDGSQIDLEAKCWMIAVANGKSEGGRYKISPESLNYDGKVEVIVVKAVQRIKLIIAFLKLSFGFEFNDTLVHRFSLQENCTIKTDDHLKCHADGEQVSPGTVINFKLLKAGLSVITG